MRRTAHRAGARRGAPSRRRISRRPPEAFDETRRRSASLGGLGAAQLVAGVALAFSAVPALHRRRSARCRAWSCARCTSASCCCSIFVLYPAGPSRPASRRDAVVRLRCSPARGFALALLPLGLRGRADPARRRAHDGRPGRRHDRRSCCVFEAARRVLGIALPIICGAVPRLRRCSASTCPAPRASRLRLRPDRRRSSASAPRASTASRRWCRRPTSSCSSCSARSSSTPG